MENKSGILLAFYGDDFTGSTDALEFISRAGARAILFTETPSAEQLNEFPGLNAFGVAGKTRSLPAADMEDILLNAFNQIKKTGARHVHYKVCSTFDSSPTIGSIGKAIDCGARVFENLMIPVLGGMPVLGRYCLFGNLYALMGIGSNGKVYRLDRHPSMSKHPVTPLDESDLRLHLGRQTTKKIGLIDILQLEKPVAQWAKSSSDEVILIDILHEEQFEKIGEWLDNQRGQGKTLFSVGSSGIELALGKYWNSTGILPPARQWPHPGKAVPLLVVSGSCSPVTTAQISWAKANGFEELVIDPTNNEINTDNAVTTAGDFLRQQKNVIIHTGVKQSQNLPAEKLGTALGSIVKKLAANNEIKRVVVSGGDTSSYAARSMEIDAVEMIAPLVVGAPLCKAYSKNKAINGLEVNFKGGQVGSEDYFGIVVNGERE